MVLFEIALVFIGFLFLIRSADEAVSRLVALSRHFGVSEFAISFIIVGIVAVLPEFSIGINSALDGFPSFALGLIFGANVADLTLVIGTVALMSGGITLKAPTARHTRWFVIAVSLPVLLFLDGELSQFDGAILVLAFLLYVGELVRTSPKERARKAEASLNVPLSLVILLASLVVLLLAGDLITGAVEKIGVLLSVPLIFLGTLLAVGTCLPELVFALRSARDKHGELGFGSILGNVFADCMLTLGVVALIAPIRPAQPVIGLISGAFMVAAALLLIFWFMKKDRIGRNDGAFLILMYVLFLITQSVAENYLISGGI